MLMKKDLILKPLLLAIVLSLVIFSCSSDDDSAAEPEDNSPPPTLFDKWWYDVDDYSADIYFHSTGEYEQELHFAGNVYPATGTWHWINEATGEMKLENLQGPIQVNSELYINIISVDDHLLTLERSPDGGSFTPIVYEDID